MKNDMLTHHQVVNGVDLDNMIGKKISRITYTSNYGFDIVLCDGSHYGITLAEFDYREFPSVTIE